MEKSLSSRSNRAKKLSSAVLTVLMLGSSFLVAFGPAGATVTIDDVYPEAGGVPFTSGQVSLTSNLSGLETGTVRVDSATDWSAGTLDANLLVGTGSTLQLRTLDRDDFAGSALDTTVWDYGDYATVANGYLTLATDTSNFVDYPYITMKASIGSFDLANWQNLTLDSSSILQYLPSSYSYTYAVGWFNSQDAIFGIRYVEDGMGGYYIDLYGWDAFNGAWGGGVGIYVPLGSRNDVRVTISNGTTGEITGDWFDAANGSWISLGTIYADFVNYPSWVPWAGRDRPVWTGEDFTLDIDSIQVGTTIWADVGTYESAVLATGLYAGAYIKQVEINTTDGTLNGVGTFWYRTAPDPMGSWTSYTWSEVNMPVDLAADAYLQFMLDLNAYYPTPSWPDWIQISLEYHTEVGAYWFDDFPDGPSGMINDASWDTTGASTFAEGLDLDSSATSSVGATFLNETWDLSQTGTAKGIVSLRAVGGESVVNGGNGDEEVLIPGFVARDSGGAMLGYVGVVRTGDTVDNYWAIVSNTASGGTMVEWASAQVYASAQPSLVRFELRNGAFSAWVLETEHPSLGWRSLGSASWVLTRGTASWRVGDVGMHSGASHVVVDWAALFLTSLAPGTGTQWSLASLLLREDENTFAVIAISGPTYDLVRRDYIFDRSPPTGDFEINGGIGYATSVVATLALSASDRYGIRYYAASESLSFPDGWHPFVSSADFLLSPGEGRKIVYVRYADNSGLVSSVYNRSIYLDLNDPNGAVYINNRTEASNSLDVTLSLIAYDVGGVDKALLSNDPGMANPTTVDLRVGGTGQVQVSRAVPWTLSAGDGIKFVYVQYVDIHTRSSRIYNDSILVDTTGPTLTAALVGAQVHGGTTYVNSSSVTVHVESSDASGVRQVEISQESNFATSQKYTGPGDLVYELPVTSAARTLYVRSTDIYGLNSIVVTLNFFVDVNAPTGSISINDGATVARSRTVSLTISATDNVGVAEMMLSTSLYFPGATWQPFTPTATFELSAGDGPTKTVYVRFKDVNGVPSQAFVDSIGLDTTPPTGSIIINNGDPTTTDKNLNLQLEGFDNFAGELQIQVSLTPTFNDSTWIPFTDTLRFDAKCTDCDVRVYYKIRDANGWESQVIDDTIHVRTATCQELGTCPLQPTPGFEGNLVVIALALVGVASVAARRRVLGR